MADQDQDIRALVQLGDTIAAIRLHQERHGGSLTAARAAIEAIRWAHTQERGASLGGLESELDALLRKGDKLGAIKRHREVTGAGLKESMAAIEARAAAPAVPPPPSPAAPPPPHQPPTQADVDAAIRSGQKILAIKHERERTGVGLKDAKDAVEARMVELGVGAAPMTLANANAGQSAPAPAPKPASGPPGLQPELDRLIQAGEKINAIKHHRQITGKTLKECKDAVEARALELKRKR